MKVLLERSALGYRASAPPLGESVEAASREEVLSALRDRIVARLVGDAEWVELDIPGDGAEPNPFIRLAGALADDPTFDDWQEIIAANRRTEDEAESIFPERNPEPTKTQ